MNNAYELYELWLKNTADNKELHDELVSIDGNNEEIYERFIAALNSAPQAFAVF